MNYNDFSTPQPPESSINQFKFNPRTTSLKPKQSYVQHLPIECLEQSTVSPLATATIQLNDNIISRSSSLSSNSPEKSPRRSSSIKELPISPLKTELDLPNPSIPPRKSIKPIGNLIIPTRHVSLPRFTVDELLDHGCLYLSPSPLNGRLQPSEALSRFNDAKKLASLDKDVYKELKCNVNIALTKLPQESYRELRQVLDVISHYLKVTKKTNSFTDLSLTSLQNVDLWLEKMGKSNDGLVTTSQLQKRKKGGVNFNVYSIPTSAGLTNPDPMTSPALLSLILDIYHNIGITCMKLNDYQEAYGWFCNVLEFIDMMHIIPVRKDRPLDYLRRCINLSSIKARFHKGYILNSIGFSDVALKELDLALETIEKCLKLSNVEDFIPLQPPHKTLPLRKKIVEDPMIVVLKHFVTELNQLKAIVFSHVASIHDSLGHVQISITVRKRSLQGFANCADVVGLCIEKVNYLNSLHLLWHASFRQQVIIQKGNIAERVMIRIFNSLGDQWLFSRRMGQIESTSKASFVLSMISNFFDFPVLGLHFLNQVGDEPWNNVSLTLSQTLGMLLKGGDKFGKIQKDEVLKKFGQNPHLWNSIHNGLTLNQGVLLLKNVVGIIEKRHGIEKFQVEKISTSTGKKFDDDAILSNLEISRLYSLCARGEWEWTRSDPDLLKEWQRLSIEYWQKALHLIAKDKEELCSMVKDWIKDANDPIDPVKPMFESNVFVIIHFLHYSSYLFPDDPFSTQWSKCAETLSLVHGFISCPTCFEMWQSSAKDDLENGLIFENRDPLTIVASVDPVRRNPSIGSESKFSSKPINPINSLPVRNKSVRSGMYGNGVWGGIQGARFDAFKGVTLHLCGHFKNFVKIFGKDE